jgi:putative glutamine amidotransferase
MRPRIGLTCGYRKYEKSDGHYTAIDRMYIDAVRMVGGRPVLIPPVTTLDEIEEIVAELDGLIVSGGPDIRAERYGDDSHPKTQAMNERREFVDFECLRLAEHRDLPVLAICLGIQELNVRRGGTLHQHVPDLADAASATSPVPHRGDGGFSYHDVRIDPASRLREIVGACTLEVNSSHHQAISRPGQDLRPTAWSPDGLIEAVEDPKRRFVVGVQWHPEELTDREPHRALFAALVRSARGMS